MRWVPGQCALFDIIDYNTQIAIEWGGTAWLCAFRINLKKKKKKRLIYKSIMKYDLSITILPCHARKKPKHEKPHIYIRT